MTRKPTGDTNPPRILIVEDEAPIRRFLRASLTAHGMVVDEAENAAEGLRSLDRKSVV